MSCTTAVYGNSSFNVIFADNVLNGSHFKSDINASTPGDCDCSLSHHVREGVGVGGQRETEREIQVHHIYFIFHMG